MKKIIFLIPLIILAISCSNKKKEADFTDLKKSRDSFFDQVEQGKFNFTAGNEFAEKSETFIKNYPKDDRNPKILMNLGLIYSNFLGDTEKGISYYKQIYEKYPKDSLAPEALSGAALLYHDKLGKFKEAKELYELIIKNYPETRSAEDAKILLKNIGKTPEQLAKDQNIIPEQDSSTSASADQKTN